MLPGEPAELVWVSWSHEALPEHLAEDLRRADMVRHADVLRVRDVGRAEGCPFVVVDHVDGLDLATILELIERSGERVPLGFAASIVLELCRVVHHLEQRTDETGAPLRWVLRGLPLDRVWIRVDGRVRVDLRGLVVPASEAARRGPTPGSFASPELRAGGVVDRTSDVWILGAVLQRLVTGRVVGEGGALPASGAPADARSSVATVAGLLARATAASPAERYANAQDLGDALRRAALVGTAPRLVRSAMASWVCDLGAAELAAQRERVAARLEEVVASRGETVSTLRAQTLGRLRGARLRGVLAGMALAGLAGGGAALLVSRRVPSTPELVLPATGALEVAASLPVRLSVDGRGQGVAEHLVVPQLAPGAHVVRAEADGHEPGTWNVVVARGGTTHLDVALEPVVEVEPAWLLVDSRPVGADVRIGGVRVGTTPMRHRLERLGRAVDVVVEKRGFAPETLTVRGLAAGERRRLSFTLGPAGQTGD